MKSINYKQQKHLIMLLVLMLITCSNFINSSFAGEGDAPLEAYFLPRDTELSSTIGSEFMSDYYKVIVPSTGRLIVRLYDIDLQDTNDELHIVKCMWFDKNNNVQRSWFPEDFLTFRPKFDKSIYPKRREFLAKQEQEEEQGV